MKWRYHRGGLYTEKKRSHWLEQWPIRKSLGDKKRRVVIGWRSNLDLVETLEQSTNGKFKSLRRSSRSKRILFVCREEDSEIWWKSLPEQRDEMKCELERGQRICPYCNVRHIQRCQEDVDWWRIREIDLSRRCWPMADSWKISGTYPWVAVSQAWSKVIITVGWVWWRHQRAPFLVLPRAPNPKPTTGFHRSDATDHLANFFDRKSISRNIRILSPGS